MAIIAARTLLLLPCIAPPYRLTGPPPSRGGLIASLHIVLATVRSVEQKGCLTVLDAQFRRGVEVEPD
jgi:hypothetical protein